MITACTDPRPLLYASALLPLACLAIFQLLIALRLVLLLAFPVSREARHDCLTGRLWVWCYTIQRMHHPLPIFHLQLTCLCPLILLSNIPLGSSLVRTGVIGGYLGLLCLATIPLFIAVPVYVIFEVLPVSLFSIPITLACVPLLVRVRVGGVLVCGLIRLFGVCVVANGSAARPAI